MQLIYSKTVTCIMKNFIPRRKSFTQNYRNQGLKFIFLFFCEGCHNIYKWWTLPYLRGEKIYLTLHCDDVYFMMCKFKLTISIITWQNTIERI